MSSRRGAGSAGGFVGFIAMALFLLAVANHKIPYFEDLRNGGSPSTTVAAPLPDAPTAPAPADPGAPAGTAQPAPASAGSAALAQLNSLTVIDKRPDQAGYERGCATKPKTQACSFGPAWTDDTDAPGGRNGCDTRNDILKASMTNVSFKAGSDCVVIAGTYADPYTGRTVTFAKADASKLQVDHIVPLSLAWDLGASTWTQEQRNAYANDEATVLLLADGSANGAKGDKGPADWMPPNKAFACDYDIRFTAVLAKYSLPVTSADKAAMTAVLASC